MPVTQNQQEYFRTNTQKPKDLQTWITTTFSHPDWSEEMAFVAVEPGRGVEFDLALYTFDGVAYKPVTMRVQLPNESTDTSGVATLTYARAATETKRRMREITPQNANVPISCSIKQWQGVDGPDAIQVRLFDGFVAKDHPKISGQDVKVQVSRYNPSLLTSQNIVTTDLYPELRTA